MNVMIGRKIALARQAFGKRTIYLGIVVTAKGQVRLEQILRCKQNVYPYFPEYADDEFDGSVQAPKQSKLRKALRYVG